MESSLETLLKKLLDEEKFITCSSKKGAIKLEEQAEREKIELEIYGLPPAAFSVRLRKRNHENQEWAFGKKRDYSKMCDYLIFIPENEEVKIVFCELKTRVDTVEKEKGGKQIVATIPLLSYFLAAIEIHFDKKWKVSKHYALIGGRYKGHVRKWKLSLKGQRSEAPYEHQKNANKKIKINLFVGSADISIDSIK